MNYLFKAAGSALLGVICLLMAPQTARAAKITGAQYCVIPAEKSYNCYLPIFAAASSCSEWHAVSVTGDAKSASATFTPPEVSALPPGWHTLYLQFQDDVNGWGPACKIQFEVYGSTVLSNGKYFLDTEGDPATAGTRVPWDTAYELPAASLKFILPQEVTSALSPAVHTLYLHTRDSQGVWGPPRPVSFEVTAPHTVAEARYYVTPGDLMPPDNPATTGRPLSAADGSFNSSIESLTGTASIPLLSFGMYTVSVIAKDSDGRWTEGWNHLGTGQANYFVGNRLTLTVKDSDKTNPGKGKDGKVTISASDWAPLMQITPSLSCNSAAPCTDVYHNGAVVTLTAVPAGPWINRVDWGGACSGITATSCTITLDKAQSSVTVTMVDTIPPDTLITSQPAKMAASNSATFGFELTPESKIHEDLAGIVYECSIDDIDGAAFTPCTSPKEYPALAEGNRLFAVRAIDKAGNVDATPASYTWLVDTIPPVVSAGGN